MRWIAVGQEAEGVIAIGQVATGVFALGQMATGVIAVGQVARGFVAIGQGAIGVFAVGMGSVGLVWSIGMIGVGGRGMGLVLPLVPSLGPKPAVPQTVSPRRLFGSQGGGQGGQGGDQGGADGQDGERPRAGYVLATLDRDDQGPLLRADGRALPLRFDPRLRAAVEGRADTATVYAHVSRTPDGWVCDELVEAPRPRWKEPGWWGWWAAQTAGLAIAAVLFWLVAGIPVVSALFDPGGILVSR